MVLCMVSSSRVAHFRRRSDRTRLCPLVVRTTSAHKKTRNGTTKCQIFTGDWSHVLRLIKLPCSSHLGLKLLSKGCRTPQCREHQEVGDIGG
jgi:hypothetical protein